MSTSLNGFFSIYLIVFLALVVLAWLASVWRQYRLKYNQCRHWVCPVCGKPIPIVTPTLRVHCRACGSVHETKHLKEK